MSFGDSPGSPREIRQDQRQTQHHGGVNTLLLAATLLDSSSISQSDPDQLQEDHRQRQHYEGVNAPLHAATLVSNSSMSHSYPDQGDQWKRRQYEGVSTLLNSVTMVSNSSTSQSKPDQDSRTDTSRLRKPKKRGYTQEQSDAIRFHKDDLGMDWNQVANTYDSLYDVDGTPWESKTVNALQLRYYQSIPMPVKKAMMQSKSRKQQGILETAPERRYWWMSGSQVTPEERVQNPTQ